MPPSPVRHRHHDLVSNWSHTNNEHEPPPSPSKVAGAYPRVSSPSGERERRHFKDPDHFFRGPAVEPTDAAAGFSSPRGRRHFADTDHLRDALEDGGPRRMADLVSNWSHTDNGSSPPSRKKVLTMHKPSSIEDPPVG